MKKVAIALLILLSYSVHADSIVRVNGQLPISDQIQAAIDAGGGGVSTQFMQLAVAAATLSLTTGDEKSFFVAPTVFTGMDLVSVHARVITAGTTGTTDIQIHNVTDATDVLSTVITIDSTEVGSDTAAVPAVIDAANDDIAPFDLWRIDIDAVSTTPPKGLIVTLEFDTP